MNDRKKGALNAMLSGLCFGLIPVLILSVSRSASIPSCLLIMLQMAVSALALAPSAIRKIRAGGMPKGFPKKMLFAGILMAATSILLYTAFDLITSSIGITLHFTYPLVVMLINALVFHARFNKQTLFAMVLVLAGIFLLCDSTVLPQHPLPGIIVAILSSLVFGVYLVWSDKSKASAADTSVYMLFLSLYNGILLAVYNLITDSFHITFTPSVIVMTLLTGALSLIAFSAQTRALNLAGSVLTSILATLEPIICVLGSALVLKDRISLRTIIGSILVLTAVILVTLASRNEQAA